VYYKTSQKVQGCLAHSSLRALRPRRPINAADDGRADRARTQGRPENCSWLKRKPKTFFVATKTEARDYTGAKGELHRSLDRLSVDHVDLLQLHNLADVIDWETALREGGALEAAVEAREEGLIRFIGITGHGLSIAATHRRARTVPVRLRVAPVQLRQMQDERYSADFEALAAICERDGVALQTIKSIALAPWNGRTQTASTWYEPLTDPAEIGLAVHWVLGRGGVFLNTVGDVDLLSLVLSAAEEFSGERPTDERMNELVRRRSLTPLFI
jgi:predicted aldo/keto reductase-like oxidoreductase